MPKTKLLSAFVDEGMHEAVRDAAAWERCAVSEFIRFALEQALAWQTIKRKEETMSRSAAQTAAIRIYKLADGVVKVAGPAITEAIKKSRIGIPDTFFNKGTTLLQIARDLKKKGVKL